VIRASTPQRNAFGGRWSLRRSKSIESIPTAIHKMWTQAQDIAYALGSTRRGERLSRGKQGRIYRSTRQSLHRPANASPTHYGILLRQRREDLRGYGQHRKVYEIGAARTEGSIETTSSTRACFLTGEADFTAESNGGRVGIATRSGNLDRPAKNWSAWSNAVRQPTVRGHFASRVSCNGSDAKCGGNSSPELQSVDVAYLLPIRLPY